MFLIQFKKTNASRIVQRMKGINQLAFDHAVAYKSALFVTGQLEMTSLTDKQLREERELKKVIQNGGITALYYFIKYKISLGNKVRTISKLMILVSGFYKKHMNSIE